MLMAGRRAGANATSQVIASRTAASPLPSSTPDCTQSPFQIMIARLPAAWIAALASGSLRTAICTRRAMSQSPPPWPPSAAAAVALAGAGRAGELRAGEPFALAGRR